MTAYDQSESRDRLPDPDGVAATPISIDDALANGSLDIWYQPKIDLRRKCLAGAEAFTYMRHPHARLLWPDDVRGALDEQNITKLTEHALVTALHHWTEFFDSGFNLRLSVNVPATVISKLSINALISTHRPQSENWPGLILEMTEDQIVRDVKLTQQIANELKPGKIALAIDEFGAGYSSFSNLRGLPFAELKLHKSFVKNCAVDVTNAAICQTAIDLAHRFGSVAVAVGVESTADLQSLMVMGCDFGQGVLLAPPLPKDEFLGALRQHAAAPRSPAAPDMTNSDRVA
jgi:EAL domain-containing protein (putative c-di-GMP-specific phosphodiesterase class I)